MVEVRFPDWSRKRLEGVAVDHAIDVAIAYDRSVSDAPVERQVVNMLRHEFSGYENNPTQEAHRVVCEAIGARFPWLQAECQRQIDARARSEAEVGLAAAWFEEHQAEQQQWRATRVEESKHAIGQFAEGMKVTAKVNGHLRNATVLKVGRTRLTIAFTIKTGEDRTAQIYAREAQPA